jgi:predicted dehydrogenase
MTNADGRAGTAAELRIGLIGAGKMGLQHVKAITALPGTRVIGVADPAADPARLAEVLPAGCQVVKTAAALLELKPDVVHIVTPPASHTALALQAIRAGSHVYIEKPFTPTRADAETIFAAAAEHGRLVCAGHQYLFEAPSLAVLESLGDIGDVVHIESYFSFRTARRTITPVDQAKDILPHAVYPLVAQLRAGTGSDERKVDP